MEYKIKLLPEGAYVARESRSKLKSQIMEFTRSLLGKRSPDKSLSPEYGQLADDLLSGRFWGVLTQIDGPFRNFKDSEEEVKKIRTENREWAQKNFHSGDLEKLLNLSINTALLKPFPTSHPGTKRGHSILYRELVEKEDSMFREAVTEDFSKRLINGRFWEELLNVVPWLNYGQSVYMVRGVLENHYPELDPWFAVKGMDILTYSTDNQPLEQKLDSVRLRYIGEEALSNYIDFMSQVEDTKTINKKYLAPLINAYVSAVLEWDYDYGNPVFHGFEEDGEQVGYFGDKLQVPFLQKYLQESGPAKDHLADKIAQTMKQELDPDGERVRFVKGIFSSVPNPKEMMQLVVSKSRMGYFHEFIEAGEESGYGLKEYFS